MSHTASLVATEWVHVFEEDGPEGAVYRPGDGELPLSRRPRERLSFSADGSATLVVCGPDDRLRPLAASWTETHGEVTLTTGSAGAAARTLRVRVKSGKLLVRPSDR